MKNMFIQIIQGFFFGVANIIPGVSGGTLALILGFYDRLIHLLTTLKPALLSEFISAWKEEKSNGLWKLFVKKDFFFGVLLGVGLLIAVVALSPLMKYLLKNEFSPTYAFFFGLILMSVWVPAKLVKKWNLKTALSFIVGVGLTIGVAANVNPADKVLAKSAQLESSYSESSRQEVKSFSYIGKYTVGELTQVAISGAVGVSAMLLPGVSGSLVLILLGQYEGVLTAIAGMKKLLLDDALFLGIFAFGMLLGMGLSSRFIKMALTKIPDLTHAFLTGLVLGSLYALWPFKESLSTVLFVKGSKGVERIDAAVIYTNQNLLPNSLAEILSPLVLCIVGIAIMIYFLKRESIEE